MKRLAIQVLSILYYSHAMGQYDLDIKKGEQSEYSKMEMAALTAAEQTGNCKHIPLYQYSPGMRFYIPHDETKESGNTEIIWYYLAKESKKQSYNRTKIMYRDLAGKVFELIKAEERKKPYQSLIFTLKDIKSDLTIEYDAVKTIDDLKKEADEKPYDNASIMFYAINTADIDSFKSAYLNKEIFANFPIKGIKFQRVKVVQVGAGTQNAPIRVVVQAKNGDIEQKDICTCGTNIPGNIDNEGSFQNSFQIDNPKDKYKGTNETWEDICKGIVRIGMTEEDLRLAWGKPSDINTTITEGKKTKQFVYYTRYAYVDNGIITALQNK